MNGLTRHQSNALVFIGNYLSTHNGRSPSLDEIGNELGLKSRSLVHALVKRLEARGHIRRTAGSARSIALVHRSHTCSACGHTDRVTQ